MGLGGVALVATTVVLTLLAAGRLANRPEVAAQPTVAAAVAAREVVRPNRASSSQPRAISTTPAANPKAIVGVAGPAKPVSSSVTPAAPVAALAGASRSAASAEVVRCVALIEHPLGSGSGFSVGHNLVVTNAHVVQGVFADEIKVQCGAAYGQPQPISKIVYYDRLRDLCLLEQLSDLTGLAVRGDYAFRSGDPVTLVGNPAARGGILMRNAVNAGQLSSMVRIRGQDFYQIDASVNPGWSGGPVIDAQGQVLAVVALKADDKIVAEIRGTMGKLDEGLRDGTVHASYDVRLTYGIPAGALARVLSDPALRDPHRQNEAGERYAARALADRLNFLAALCMTRMQVSVPRQVRLEWSKVTQGRGLVGTHYTSGEPDAITLLPESECVRLDARLRSRDLVSTEAKLRDRLDQRIEAIQGSTYLPEPLKRDLKALAATVRQGNRFAEHPSTTCVLYCATLKEFFRDVQDYLKHIAEALQEKET